MSGTRFYQNLDNYPPVVRSAVKRCLIFVAQILYKEEFEIDPNLAQRRVVISDKVGPEFDISLAIEAFQQFSANMPFTAYNIEAIEDGEIKNWSALSANNYFADVGRYGGAIQQTLTLNFTSFFNRADDYWQAISRLKHGTSVLTRLYVPITLNDVAQSTRPGTTYAVDSQYPLDLIPEISQGEYAFKFKTYLQENKIYDISHKFKLSFYDFGFSDYMADLSVTDMVFRLFQQHQNGSSTLLETLGFHDAPIVTSTTPADGALGVNFDIPQIVINFNNPMMELDTQDKIMFTPPIFDYDAIWSSDSKTLTYYIYDSPYTTLQPNTDYTIDIPNTIVDVYGHNPEFDKFVKFTTLTDPY